MSEKEIFEQKVCEEELEAVAGGKENDMDHCEKALFRDIRAGGFPNCASGVEAGSHCFTNDACEAIAVMYTNMMVCSYAFD